MPYQWTFHCVCILRVSILLVHDLFSMYGDVTICVFSVSLMNSVFAGSLSVLDQPEQTSMQKAGSVDSDSFQDGKLAGRSA